MNKHRQIFFLIRNFELKMIEPKTHEGFKVLFHLLKEQGYHSRKETDALHPNSTIGVIDLQEKTFGVSNTVFIGYMFATHFPDKTLLDLQTVLDHFSELVIQEDSDLLDQLYRQAKITKDERKKVKDHE